MSPSFISSHLPSTTFSTAFDRKTRLEMGRYDAGSLRSIECFFSSCRTMVILQRHGNMSCWASCSISYGNFVEMAKCSWERKLDSYTAMRTKITLKCVCVMLPADQPSNSATKCVPRSRSFHEQKFDNTIRRKWEWKWVAFIGTEIRMGLTWE